MNKLPFRDVQYVYTNICNLAKKTNYCKVPENMKNRANIKEIKKALDIFKRFNLQVKVLGGNPSDENDFYEFIDYMNKIELDYVVTDNSMNYENLEYANVKGVMFSLDTLGKSNIGGCSYDKSMKAKQAIPLIRSFVKYLGANIIINMMNIDEIPEIIKYLTMYNAIANLCPLIVGENKNFRFTFRVKESKYSLNDVKRDKLEDLSKKLIEMKKSGYLIGCPEEYIEKLPDVIMKHSYGWNCDHISSIPILRVNTDLSLMICSDIEGTEISKYTIFDLEDSYDEINRAWLIDKHKRYCCEQNGCYWSNIVIADIYRRQGLGTLEATRRNL